MVTVDFPARRRRRSYLATRLQVWPALFFRDAPGHAGHLILLGLFRRLIEPTVMILATVGMAWLINRTPPYGKSILLWCCTGVAPIFLCVHISKYVVKGRVTKGPGLSDFDAVTVTAILELIFCTLGVIGLFALLYYAQGKDAAPHEWWSLSRCWLTTALFGFGLGLVFRTLCRVFPVVDVLYPAMNRIWLHLSGVYFVTDRLPPEIRRWVALNPLIHLVTWFRLSFFPTFPTHVYSLNYLLICTAVLLVIGIPLEFAMGDRIKDE